MVFGLYILLPVMPAHTSLQLNKVFTSASHSMTAAAANRVTMSCSQPCCTGEKFTLMTVSVYFMYRGMTVSVHFSLSVHFSMKVITSAWQ